MTSNEEPTGTEPQNSGAKLSLNILEFVTTSQQQNGLRHRDYQRYRQYCARRLRRLRKNKNVDFKLSGKPREAFQGRELTAADCTEVRFLQLALVNAERAWGYAMQLKDENQRDGEDSRKRLHLVRRLAKATQWAAKLRELCNEVADDRTALEAEAYAAWMKGNLLLEKEWWKDAYFEFEKARNVYTQLSEIVEPELRELMRERIEDIEPAVRYCKYNLSREGPGGSQEALKQLQAEAEGSDLLQAKIKKVMEENRRMQSDQASTISWRGQQVPVRSSAMRVKLLEIRDQLNDLEEAKRVSGGAIGEGDELETAFLSALSACDETLRLAREEKSKPPKQSATSTANPEKIAEEYDYIHAYVKTQKLLVSLDRNMLYASKVMRKMDSAEASSAKPQELVHIYNLALQSVQDILDMLGPDADEHSSPDDIVTAEQMRTQEAICKAFRSLMMGRTFQLQTKWSQALALFEHNFSRIAETRNLDGLTDNQSKQLDEVESKTRAAKCVALAAAFRARIDANKSSQEQHLVEGLKSSSAGDVPTLCELPPSIEPVPSHPILFDLASSELRIGKLPKPGKSGKTTKSQTSSPKSASATKETEEPSSAQTDDQDDEQAAGWLSSARNWFGRR